MISALYGGNEGFFNGGLKNLFTPRVRGVDVHEERPDRLF
jgi:hypothetical protein